MYIEKENLNEFWLNNYDDSCGQICLVDTSLDIIKINRSMRMQYDGDDSIIGKNCMELIQSWNLTPLKSLHDNSICTSPICLEPAHSLAMKKMVALAQPLFDAKSKHVGFLIMSNSLLWHDNNEQLDEQLQRICNRLVVPMMQINLVNGNIMCCNEALETLTGYSSEDLIGQKYIILYPEQYQNIYDNKLLMAISNTFEHSIYAEIQTQQGDIIPVQLASHALDSIANGQVQITVTDLSQIKALENELDMFQKLLDNIQDAIFIVDPDTSRIIYFNDQSSEFLNYQKHILSSMKITDFDVGLADAGAWNAHIEYLKDAKCGKYTTEYRHADNHVLSVRVTFSFIVFSKQKYIVFVVKDLMNKHAMHMKANSDHFETMINRLPDPICTIDENGIVSYASSSIKSILGYPASHIEGTSIFNYFLTQYQSLVKREVASALLGSDVNRIDAMIVTSEGLSVHVEVAVTVIESQSGIGRIQLMIHDMTDRKLFEHKLFAEKERADRANKAKNNFIRNMTYELKMPLNDIVGMGALMKDSELNFEQKDYLQTMLVSSESMSKIINNINDIAQIETGRMQLKEQSFNLQKTLEDIIGSYAFRSKNSQVDLIYSYPINMPRFVIGDSGKFRQVLSSLLSNQIIFSSQEMIRELYIKISTARLDGNRLLFRVDMYNQQEMISGKDLNVSLMGSKNTMSDIELGVVEQLLKMMNGSISCNAKEHGNAHYSFSLYFKLVDNDIMAIEANSSFEGKSIIVIDQNQTSLKCIVEYLRSLNFTVHPYNCNVDISENNVCVDFVDLVVVNLNMISQKNKLVDCIDQLKSQVLLKDDQLILIGDDDFQLEGYDSKDFSYHVSYPIQWSQFTQKLINIFEAGDKPIDFVQKGVEIQPLYDDRFDGKRILLVEDNQLNQRVAKCILEKIGFDVVSVNNGQEAVNSLQENLFNIVLMDIQMPIMDGWHATRIIRMPNSPVKNHSIPIIAMTAKSVQDDEGYSLEVGMDDYIAKPIDADALKKVILKYI